jgi:uncharacterized protein (TIGR03083 family)
VTSRLDQPLALPIAVYIDAIRMHGDLLVDTAEAAGLDTPVPTCPGWTVRDLVQHTEAVHRQKTEAVRTPTLDGPPPKADVPADAGIASYRESLSEMLGVFEASDLTPGSWTWCTHEHRADWWVRRMAHETAVHAADALAAVGAKHTLDPALAIDGVDEILEEMLIGGPAWGSVTPGKGRIDLVSDDRTWSLRFATFSGTSPRTQKQYDIDTLVFDGSDQPETTVTVDPSTLDLWLWGRAELPADAVTGDVAGAGRLRDVAAEGTQ